MNFHPDRQLFQVAGAEIEQLTRGLQGQCSALSHIPTPHLEKKKNKILTKCLIPKKVVYQNKILTSNLIFLQPIDITVQERHSLVLQKPAWGTRRTLQ